RTSAGVAIGSRSVWLMRRPYRTYCGLSWRRDASTETTQGEPDDRRRAASRFALVVAGDESAVGGLGGEEVAVVADGGHAVSGEMDDAIGAVEPQWGRRDDQRGSSTADPGDAVGDFGFGAG